VSLPTFLQEKTNISPSNNKMTNTIIPTMSASSSQITPLHTAATLAAHQLAITASPSTNTSQGGWVCGGEMYHRPATPNPEQWNGLIEHDQLAADIEEILRAAVKAKKGQGN
jgi:hypothetical protein